jgi:small-conductance mechanosensitive channel
MENLLNFFSTPLVVSLILVVAAFILSYISYRIIIFILKKLACRNGIWAEFEAALKRPFFWLQLEIAVAFSLNAMDLQKIWDENLNHALNIFIIATVGWFFAAIAHAFFRHFESKAEDSEKANAAYRTMFTQVLFLYRILMFVIFLVTAAAILITFPYIKSVGVGILGSAGIAGIALGVAARPILLNLMAGFQIAATKTIKIGDTLHLEGESVRVESLHLTHVVARTWDCRRLILPISYFIDKPFQNWDTVSPEIFAKVFLHCDYKAPVEAIRLKVEELLKLCSYWNKKVWKVHVTECSAHSMQIRIIASANDARLAFELSAYLNEKLIEYLQKEHPSALPCLRTYQYLDS